MIVNDTTFRTQRALQFSPQAVYHAFSSAKALAAWWGPDGFTNEFERFEFKVGGLWQFVMVGPEGARYPNQNIFVELAPASRVVIRHDCAPFFTLTVQLSPAEGGTHVVWEQVFDDATVAQAVQAVVVLANEQNLNRLTRVLESTINRP